jgi:hypothetical protein
MPNSNPSRRQFWLTASRITTISLLFVLVALSVAALVQVSRLANKPSPRIVVTATQADQVAQAASFLQDVGFNSPVYKGITPATEGQYPTFTATAIGGKSVDLWIRTTPNGGWEIQPVGMFETVASADDFARKAQEAVDGWMHLPASIKPRTDGAYGEYESKKYNYDLLAKYNPDSSYWRTSRSETSGWPSK